MPLVEQTRRAFGAPGGGRHGRTRVRPRAWVPWFHAGEKKRAAMCSRPSEMRLTGSQLGAGRRDPALAFCLFLWGKIQGIVAVYTTEPS